MRKCARAAALAALALLALSAANVDAHGFMKVPLSRNKMAHERGEGSPDGPVNYCPHCSNLGGGRRTAGLVFPETPESARTLGLCGDAPVGPSDCWDGGDCPQQDHMPGGRFYTPGSNGGGEIVATYVEGDVIDVQYTITAHHRGMIVMRLCDEARVTEECLEKYPPLERFRYEDEELIQAQPINPEFPFIYFLNPVCSFGLTGNGGNSSPLPGGDAYSGYPQMNAKFKLPAGVSCESCVLQMHWITANSCIPPTYRGFEFPPKYQDCAGDGGSGFYSENFADCEGSVRAEEFWNCADISILPADGSEPPAQCPPWGPWGPCEGCDDARRGLLQAVVSRSEVGAVSRSAAVGAVSRGAATAAGASVVSRASLGGASAASTGTQTRTREVPPGSDCEAVETRPCDCPGGGPAPPPVPPPPPPPPLFPVDPPADSPAPIEPGEVTVALTSIWDSGFVNTFTAASAASIQGRRVAVIYEGSPQMVLSDVWNASQDGEGAVSGDLVTYTFTVQYNGFGFVASNLDSSVTSTPVSVYDPDTMQCLVSSCIGMDDPVDGPDDPVDDPVDGPDDPVDGPDDPVVGPVEGIELLDVVIKKRKASGFRVNVKRLGGKPTNRDFKKFIKNKPVDYAFRMNEGDPGAFEVTRVKNAELLDTRVDGNMVIVTFKQKKGRFNFDVARTGDEELVGVFSQVTDADGAYPCLLDECAVAGC